MPKAKGPRLVTYSGCQDSPAPTDIDQATTISRSKAGYHTREVYTNLPMQSRSGVIDEKASAEGVGDSGMSGLKPSNSDWDSWDSNEPVHDFPITQPGNIEVHMKAKRYENSDMPLLTWKTQRQTYLDCIISLDGRGRFTTQCSTPDCIAGSPIYRCRDCFGNHMFCKECMVRRHHREYLHIIEIWDQRHFRKVPMNELDVQVQLGHQFGLCSFRKRAHKNFVVIHVNGIHSLTVNFCGCPGAPQEYKQLLEVGWWPSTHTEPRTAATMSVLKLFHTLNLQGQIAPTDFYRGLEQMTSGDGLHDDDVPDRLEQWMTITREWRHVKMAKRAGRGHDPAGIDNTEQGGLGVPCRCCPHPMINLPIGWESASREHRWLYALILAADANFRQKARLRPSKHVDDALGPGWGTFVSNGPYLEHVSQYADQNEISHCVGFSALWSANTKKSKGLRATGVAAISCVRHELYRPNGMGDLQLGERYCNMDYLLLSTLVGTSDIPVVVSYDIACQWGINFSKRVNNPLIPSYLKDHHNSLQIHYLVPKFHLEAHMPKCHAPFSFNYAPGVGRTDGEGVERNWSILNGITSSVSMMTSGGRWDVIDDFCNFLNWRKTVNIVNTLLRKMTKAIPQAIIHHQAFSAFTQSLEAVHHTKAKEWELAVIKWEMDHSAFCPYDLPDKKITFSEVKQRLMEQEHEKVAQGDASTPVEGTTATNFIVMLLELEQAQQELCIDLGAAPLVTRPALLQRRTNLLKRIQTFGSHQKVFLPGLPNYLASLNPPKISKSTPELIPLYPPSVIAKDCRTIVCTGGVEAIELEFRFAQVSEALVQLRLQLAKRTCATRYRSRNIVSQRYLTRFRELQSQTEIRIKVARIRYNAARNAILELHGPGDWEKTYRVLQASDIVGLGERVLEAEEQAIDKQMEVLAGHRAKIIPTSFSDDRGADSGTEEPVPTAFGPELAVGEGVRVLSWIWHSTSGAELENQSTEAYLRVEWLRCRARAQRWKEEIQLVEEEMRRAIEFCHWKACWWNDQENLRIGMVEPHILEGITAYAAEQADTERRRSEMWAGKWHGIRKRAQDVLTQYLTSEDSIEADNVLDSLPVEITESDDETSDDPLLD